MQKRRTGSIIVLIILLVVIATALFLYSSPMFERIPPKIALEKDIHWNLRDPIPLNVKDDSGIKFLRVTLSDGENSIVLLNETYAVLKKEIDTHIEYPRTGFFSKSSTLVLKVEATDGSKWNMLRGNRTIAKAQIFPDTKHPNLFTLTNSYKITKGGAALVAFKAEDENLKDVYIDTSFGHRFKPIPFYKEGYFVSLLAWPSHEDTFKAEIVAIDKAGNESKTRIKLFLENKRYKNSTIVLKESFIEGKITDLAKRYARDFSSMDDLGKFRFVNETLRIEDEKTVAKATSAVTPMPTNKRIIPFYPLRNAAAVASFGDYRTYTYGGKKVSESYHLGLDLASTAQADIVSTNVGTVVFAQESGIYGKTVIIDHGLGIYSLYSHCSAMMVSQNDVVEPGDIIAKTGITGLALGDHLHFGMIVQGIEVRPEEWMDSKWMSDNIYGIMQNAKELIDRQER